MVQIPRRCRNCGSDRMDYPCENCHDETPEAYWIRRARDRYARDEIHLEEFEEEAWRILNTSPLPRPPWPRYVYR